MPTASRPDLIERRMSRFLREPVSVRNAASVIVVATLVVVVAGGVGIRILDHHEYSSIWNGMWYMLQTVTTVGYGDVSRHTEAGRAVGAVVMIIGTGLVALLTAAAAQRFLTNEIRRDVPTAVGDAELSEAEILAELRRVRDQLDRLSAAVERRGS